MKRKEILEQQHSKVSVEVGTIAGFIDALKTLEYDESQADSFFSRTDGIMVLGAIGDPKFGNQQTKSTAKFNLKGMRPGDPHGDGARAYFDPNNFDLVFQTDIMQALYNGTLNPEQANTIVHEIMHRGFAVISQMPELKRLVHPDLNSVWKGGWGSNTDYNAWPLIDNLQTTPEHAMIYSVLNSGRGWYWNNIVWPLVSRHPVAIDFFNSPDFQSRTILANVDADPATGVEKIRLYWQTLYYSTSNAISGYLQNMISAPRPKARPTRPGARPGARPSAPEPSTGSSTRLSTGVVVMDLSDVELIDIINQNQELINRILRGLNENLEVYNKYFTLLETRVSLFEQRLSDKDRESLETAIRDLSAILAAKGDDLSDEQTKQIQDQIAAASAVLQADEESRTPDGEGEVPAPAGEIPSTPDAPEQPPEDEIPTADEIPADERDDPKVAIEPDAGADAAIDRRMGSDADATRPTTPLTAERGALARELSQINTRDLMTDYNRAGRGKPSENTRKLQTALSLLGYDPGPVDGLYGQSTYAAVQKFQTDQNIQVDGQAGPETLGKLVDALGGASNDEYTSSGRGDGDAEVDRRSDDRRSEYTSSGRGDGDAEADRRSDDRRGTAANPRIVATPELGELRNYVFLYSAELEQQYRNTHDVVSPSDRMGQRPGSSNQLLYLAPVRSVLASGTPIPQNPRPVVDRSGFPINRPQPSAQAKSESTELERIKKLSGL